LPAVFEREGIGQEYWEDAGLVAKSPEGNRWYDRFRGRLIFPIHNESGKLIAFAGRALRDDQQPKYLNSPDTPIYTKRNVLYNLQRARQAVRAEERVILVEGYMDVIGLAEAGVEPVVASCGTSLTTEQSRAMRRQADEVVINFDADAAGQSASQRSIELLLQEGFRVRILTLPEGLDPDEFCRRHGGQKYREVLSKAPDYLLWLADRARRQFDTHTAEGRLRAFRFLMPTIHLLRDKLERVSLANEVAAHLGVEQGLVLEQFRRAAAERRNAPLGRDMEETFSKGEKLLLRLLVESEDARADLLDAFAELARNERLPSEVILQALQMAAQQGEAFSYSAVEARLQEKDRDALARIVFDQETILGTPEDGRGALDALLRLCWERRYSDLRREIAGAERAKDHGQALALLRKKKELEEEGRRQGWLALSRGASGSAASGATG
jgi:DNA primase